VILFGEFLSDFEEGKMTFHLHQAIWIPSVQVRIQSNFHLNSVRLTASKTVVIRLTMVMPSIQMVQCIPS